MASPSIPPPSLFFIAITHTRSIEKKDLLRELESRFGKLLLVSDSFDFNFTDYYKKEMGDNLVKFIAVFAELQLEDRLADHKLNSMELEKIYLDGQGNRRVNLDPGFLSQARLILSSSKNFAQRIYLGKGVFAEITLLYRHEDFIALPWSYPDYQSPFVKGFLLEARREYTRILKGG